MGGEGLGVWEGAVPDVGELDEPGSDDDEQPEAVSARSTAAAPAAVRITVTPDHLPARHRPSTEVALPAERTCDRRLVPTLSGDRLSLSPSLVLRVWMYRVVLTRSRTGSWDGADIHRAGAAKVRTNLCGCRGVARSR